MVMPGLLRFGSVCFAIRRARTRIGIDDGAGEFFEVRRAECAGRTIGPSYVARKLSRFDRDLLGGRLENCCSGFKGLMRERANGGGIISEVMWNFVTVLGNKHFELLCVDWMLMLGMEW